MEKYGEGFIGQSPIPELNHEISSNSPALGSGSHWGRRLANTEASETQLGLRFTSVCKVYDKIWLDDFNFVNAASKNSPC